MGDDEHRQRVLEERMAEEREQEPTESRIMKEERERALSRVRTIKIWHIKFVVTATEVAHFFHMFGEPISVCLQPKKGADNRPELKHSGRGVVEFASSETVYKLERLPSVRVDDTSRNGACMIPSRLGLAGHLKFARFVERRHPDSSALESSLLFKTRKLELGNFVGSGKAVYSHQLQNEIEVNHFPMGLTWELQQGDSRYRFELAYKHVSAFPKAGIQPLEGERAALLLPVRQPPKIFRLPLRTGVNELSGASESPQDATRWEIDPDKWIRTTDFTPNGSIGSSFLYRFTLPYTIAELENKNNLVVAALWGMGILQPGRAAVADVKSQLSGRSTLADRLAAMPFNVSYFVECLLSTGLLCRHQLNQTLLTILEDERLPKEIIIQALSLMLTGKRRIANPVKDLRRLISEILHDQQTIQDLESPLPDYCMMVGRVLVTPTRVVCLPPELELSNRVLRHYKQHADRFIRISFGEENGGILHLGPRMDMNADLVKRMEDILECGITVGQRRFEFLAFSTSQLKEHSVWAFAPLEAAEGQPRLSTDDVRNWMGDFQGIKCVAKYAARMGQCFSSTLDTVELLSGEVTTICDIERNGYVFSDGCGLISEELAEAVVTELKQQNRISPQVKVNPSAFQLRFGGLKGVVVTYPTRLRPELAGRKMLIRPSMDKFQAAAKRLEVVGISRYLPAFLNRQIISILYQKSLGVPDRAFQELQDNMLGDLNHMLRSGHKALEVLADYGSVEGEGQVQSIRSMIEAGISVQSEPYLRGMLSAIRLHLLKDLKNKSRIYVPEAALLMGVVDETGVLEYGEVFVQIDRSQLLDSPLVVSGDIMVAKNPCFHPGDVRVLKAVAAPQLHHLRNVIVFPQKGRRPHPNEISGSDLDGDNYFCCWRKSLIPPNKEARPMEFPAALPRELDHAVRINDVAGFFVDHALSDNLGVIANAHLALADLSADGVTNPKCLRLAELHSNAVDFPKTGIPVEVPNDLRPQRFPDFMEKLDKESYQSRTILGVMYRQIQEPLKQSLPGSCTQQEAADAFDPDLLVEGYEAYIEGTRGFLTPFTVQRHKRNYEQLLLQVMNQFNNFSESQLITGCIVEWDTMRKRRNGKRFDAKAHVVEATQGLRKKYRRIFERELDNRGVGDDVRAVDARQQASAWYYVTYHPSQSSQKSLKFYSFAWVKEGFLCEIKRLARAAQKA